MYVCKCGCTLIITLFHCVIFAFTPVCPGGLAKCRLIQKVATTKNGSKIGKKLLIKNLYQVCCNSIFNYAARQRTRTHTHTHTTRAVFKSFSLCELWICWLKKKYTKQNATTFLISGWDGYDFYCLFLAATSRMSTIIP